MDKDIESLSSAVQRSIDLNGGGGGGKVGLLERVATRLFSDDLQGVVEKFLDNHVSLFQELTPAHIESGENTLEWWDAYQRFIALFDKSLEEIVKEEGGTIEEFAKLAEDEKNLSEDEKIVIELLQASSEYTSFLNLMYDEVQDRKFEER
jgi:hypothetical protein